MNMKTLSVITTTYNRAYCLHQVYESLCRQTCNDFLWLIIDDGSTDDTELLVKKWQGEGQIDIEYYYKPNGGMHTARNLAYEKCNTPLNVIIDSDDWMTDDGVEIIVSTWHQYGYDGLYGIAANNVDTNGKLTGTPMPEGVKECTCGDLFDKYGVRGDKKFILRSDLSKLYPYPEFEGEKFYPASYKFYKLDQNYRLYLTSAAVCVVNYNEDSMTYNKYAQYKTCCKGFAHYRNEIIGLVKSPKKVFEEEIHYIAESIYAKSKHYISRSARPLYALIAWPFGVVYYWYLERTSKKY